MKTDYEAHRQDENGTLSTLHNFWCIKHRFERPLDNQAGFLQDNERFAREEGVATALIVLAFTLIAAAVIIGTATWEASLLIGLAIASFMATMLVLSFHITSFVRDNWIWVKYQKDLGALLESFPFLADMTQLKGKDVLREIGSEIDLRATQIAAKQRLGIVAEAKQEKDALLEDQSLAHDKFGLARDIKHYFPVDEAA